MSIRMTRRRIIGGLVLLTLVGGIAGAVALRKAKHVEDAPRAAVPAALQFSATDLAYVENTALARWLQVSGTLQPVRQAVVKAKVAGDLAEFTALGIFVGRIHADRCLFQADVHVPMVDVEFVFAQCVISDPLDHVIGKGRASPLFNLEARAVTFVGPRRVRRAPAAHVAAGC